MSEIEIALKAVELYATRHPRPPHVDQKQAALMVGVSEPTIRKLIRHGTFKLNKFGKIPTEQIDQAIAAQSK